LFTGKQDHYDDESWRLGALYKDLTRVRMSWSKVKVTGDKKWKTV